MKPPDDLLPSVGFIFVSILLVLIVLSILSPGSKEFWPSIIMALIPAICGIDEIVRYLRR